jgi:hypothetical protein
LDLVGAEQADPYFGDQSSKEMMDWPFQKTDDETVMAVDRAVPQYIDADKRADICQSLCLLIIEHKINQTDLSSGFANVIRHLKKTRPDRHFVTWEDITEHLLVERSTPDAKDSIRLRPNHQRLAT